VTFNDIRETALGLTTDERRQLARDIIASLPPPSVSVGTSMAETELLRLLEGVDKAIGSFPPGDSHTAAFRAWLEPALGAESFPPELIGDLAHLTLILEDLYHRLIGCSVGGHVTDRAATLAQLWALQFDLTKTLAPNLRDLRKDLSHTLPRRASQLR
jgi:hypothetical protein